jgi:hypothetical protein
MGDVLHSFLKLRGLIKDDKNDKEIKKKNKEYVVEKEQQFKVAMINKIIDEKPKEKYIIKYFRERLQELDDIAEQDD